MADYHDIGTMLQHAAEHFQRAEWLQAEALYHDVLAQEPEQPYAYHGLACLAVAIGDLETAETLLAYALEALIAAAVSLENRRDIAVWLTERADILFGLGRFQEARDCLADCQRRIQQNLTDASSSH
jgi:tetratricopeptide (TPR) repeat protein